VINALNTATGKALEDPVLRENFVTATLEAVGASIQRFRLISVIGGEADIGRTSPHEESGPLLPSVSLNFWTAIWPAKPVSAASPCCNGIACG
jgi:hypothetical protein